ncbi:MAG: Holliday junction branch migration protein RuvA [Tannerella sp.]|jgi:Holliday junction DNA helicase RuvA|nr:Holliday junction branch migration protein RuvA [Tannerella sp.]
MIEYLRGEIVELSPARMIMDCNGLGYEVHISLTTYSAYRNQAAGRIYVYEVIREDAHLLYGFATKEERELFLLLISVSGVGPNTARMILSSMQPAELVDTIASGNESGLTTVKGIGSKTAQRVIVDLKNKVKTAAAKAGENGTGAFTPGYAETVDEAISALVMLGFQRAASQKAVQTILKKTPGKPELTVEQLIKATLKML